MLTHRIRHVLVAVFAAIAFLGALILAVSAQPAPAQAAPGLPAALAGDAALVVNQPVSATSTLYLPLVAHQVAPCSVAPRLITPTNQSTLTTLIPTMIFLRQTDAVSFTFLQVSTKPDFSVASAFSTVGGSDPGLVYAAVGPDNLQPATVYYWRTQDYCNSGPGPFSSVFRFTSGSGGVIPSVPFLLSPANGAINTGSVVTFTWLGDFAATGYQLFLLYPDGSSSAAYANAQFIVFDNLVLSGNYTWYVRAYNDYAYSAQSVHRTFRTGTLLAAQPKAAAAEPRSGSGWLRAAEDLRRR